LTKCQTLVFPITLSSVDWRNTLLQQNNWGLGKCCFTQSKIYTEVMVSSETYGPRTGSYLNTIFFFFHFSRDSQFGVILNLKSSFKSLHWNHLVRRAVGILFHAPSGRLHFMFWGESFC
jgi:hypothetical protein